MTDIKLDQIETKKLELIQKVNALKKSNVIGTDELEDVVDLYYEVCELLEESAETGEKPGILGLLAQLGQPLISAVSGSNMLLAEATDLIDDEILILAARSSKFKLGDNAVRYEQVIKLALFGFQTYSVFR